MLQYILHSDVYLFLLTNELKNENSPRYLFELRLTCYTEYSETNCLLRLQRTNFLYVEKRYVSITSLLSKHEILLPKII